MVSIWIIGHPTTEMRLSQGYPPFRLPMLGITTLLLATFGTTTPLTCLKSPSGYDFTNLLSSVHWVSGCQNILGGH